MNPLINLETLQSRKNQLVDLVTSVARMPTRFAKHVTRVTEVVQATDFARSVPNGGASSAVSGPSSNPLREYATHHTKGRGIWKWDHYFDIYHRHLSKFVGQPAHLLEVGIFSGGSLEMWRAYLGEKCRLTGVDIQAACKAYENDFTRIEIGDQADRSFWQGVRERGPALDIVIDDGGHTHEQQRVTLEELLPALRPGGVFICEDVHSVGNPFTSYIGALVDQLNAFSRTPEQAARNEYASEPSALQQMVHSIHWYPYLVVIEKREVPLEQLAAVRRGSEWQPFL